MTQQRTVKNGQDSEIQLSGNMALLPSGSRHVAIPSGRLDYIDGLRGLAAIAVVFQHIAERIMIHDPDNSSYLHFIFVTAINTGRFGIALFFLISGYVVPFSFKEPHAFLRFAIGRFFRLYPAYWLSIAAAVVLLTSIAGAHFAAWTILANITMLQTALGQPGILGPYWTLIIELTFYGFCALLYLTNGLSDRRTLFSAFAFLLALSLALSIYGALSGHYVSANLPLNLSLMFLGTILRLVTRKTHPKPAKGELLLLFLIFAAIPIILFAAPARHQEFYSNSGFCIAYWSGLIIFMLSTVWGYLSFSLLRGIGIISYSLYLFHDLILSIYEHLFEFNNITDRSLFVLASLFTAIFFSNIVYKTVEHPAIQIGKFVSEVVLLRMFPRDAEVVSPTA